MPTQGKTLIGIFGGSFDPVHIGHVRIALDACKLLEFQKIRFIPLGRAVHREQPQTTATQRKAMLELALENQPCLSLDCRELQNERPSYTVDTLNDLQRELPGVSLCLIMGSDAFSAFDRWHEPERILDLCHLLVLQRPGETVNWSESLRYLMTGRVAMDKTQLQREKSGLILLETASQLDISSTAVRACLEAGDSTAGLINGAVAAYIAKHGLYVDGDQRKKL